MPQGPPTPWPGNLPLICRNPGKNTTPVKSPPREIDNPGKVVIAGTHAGARKIRLSAVSAEARMPFFRSVAQGILTDRKKSLRDFE